MVESRGCRAPDKGFRWRCRGRPKCSRWRRRIPPAVRRPLRRSSSPRTPGHQRCGSPRPVLVPRSAGWRRGGTAKRRLLERGPVLTLAALPLLRTAGPSRDGSCGSGSPGERDGGAERGAAKALGSGAVRAVAVGGAVAGGLHERLVGAHDVALSVVEELVDLRAQTGAEQPPDPWDAVDGALEDREQAGRARSRGAVEIHGPLAAGALEWAPCVDGDRPGRGRVRVAGVECDGTGGRGRGSAPGAQAFTAI